MCPEVSAVPLYQYVCETCGKAFEELTSVEKRDDVVCPVCGGPVKRAYEGKGAFGPMKYASKERPAACEGCPHACAG